MTQVFAKMFYYWSVLSREDDVFSPENWSCPSFPTSLEYSIESLEYSIESLEYSIESLEYSIEFIS